MQCRSNRIKKYLLRFPLEWQIVDYSFFRSLHFGQHFRMNSTFFLKNWHNTQFFIYKSTMTSPNSKSTLLFCFFFTKIPFFGKFNNNNYLLLIWFTKLFHTETSHYSNYIHFLFPLMTLIHFFVNSLNNFDCFFS